MNENIFGIDNFNLISDNQYYYVFRALNRDDQREIVEKCRRLRKPIY